jgi:hypothetical protein
MFHALRLKHEQIRIQNDVLEVFETFGIEPSPQNQLDYLMALEWQVMRRLNRPVRQYRLYLQGIDAEIARLKALL